MYKAKYLQENSREYWLLIIEKKQPPEVFCKKRCRSLILLKNRLWHRCFPVNFAKFLRTPFYRTPSGDCLCIQVILSVGQNVLVHFSDILGDKSGNIDLIWFSILAFCNNQKLLQFGHLPDIINKRIKTAKKSGRTRLSLRKKCLYSELFWSAFSLIWTEYGEIRSISLYSVRIRENADQNNS